MRKFIRDVFQTKQSDGTYVWDMTNAAWPACIVIIASLSAIAAGWYMMIFHPDKFSMSDWLGGLAGLAAGGGLGVWAHSKANA